MSWVTLELAGVDFHCTEVLEITRPQEAWAAVERAARSSHEQRDGEISVYDGQGAILIRTSLRAVLRANVAARRAGKMA